MKKFIPQLLEYFLGEAPTDDDDKPLRSLDPFGINPKQSALATPSSTVKSAMTGAAPKPGMAGRAVKPQDPRATKQEPEVDYSNLAKPGFKGKFHGQTWTTNTQARKDLPDKDKPTQVMVPNVGKLRRGPSLAGGQVRPGDMDPENLWRYHPDKIPLVDPYTGEKGMKVGKQRNLDYITGPTKRDIVKATPRKPGQDVEDEPEPEQGTIKGTKILGHERERVPVYKEPGANAPEDVANQKFVGKQSMVWDKYADDWIPQKEFDRKYKHGGPITTRPKTAGSKEDVPLNYPRDPKKVQLPKPPTRPSFVPTSSSRVDKPVRVRKPGQKSAPGEEAPSLADILAGLENRPQGPQPKPKEPEKKPEPSRAAKPQSRHVDRPTPEVDVTKAGRQNWRSLSRMFGDKDKEEK